MNKKNKLLLTSMITLPIFPVAMISISCQDTNKIKDKSSNDLNLIKQEFLGLDWKDFNLSKKFEENNLNYKDFTYESFFEWDSDNLSKLEINEKTENLNSKESLLIDNDEIRTKYLSAEFNKLLDNYNENKNDDEKLVIVLRSQKLPMPEASILVWTWLTNKKHLKESTTIQKIKYFEKSKIVLYGHWFFNEEYENAKKNNSVWNIVSYVVPTIAIGGLLLYILIAILIKRKKVAFKSKKGLKK